MALSCMSSYFKAIEDGDFDNFDMEAFMMKFKTNASKYGDHLQYTLHKYCKQSEKTEVEMTVINLSKLCFSKESASGFNNMDRFLGSLFHISSYFLKRCNYSVALEINNAIDLKETEIEECAVKNVSIRNVLYALHSLFVSSAQTIADDIGDAGSNEEMQLSYELAQMSIKFLMLMKFKQLEIGKKVFRNFKNYFNALKLYEKRNVFTVYQGVEDALSNIMPMYCNNSFLHFYLIKLDQVENEGNMNVADLNKHFQRHLGLISVFMNDSTTLKYWEALLCGEAVNVWYLKEFTNAAVKIIANKQSKLHLLLFSIFFNHAAQLWIKNYSDNWPEIFTSKIIQQIYARILLPIRGIMKSVTELCTIANFQMGVCFMDLYRTNLLWILQMIRLCLKYNVSGSLDLVKISREIFSYIQGSLNESKRVCCAAREKHCWTSLGNTEKFIYYTNTVEGLLKQTDSDRVWTFMKDCCEELLCEILNSELELPFDWKRVKILFQRWHFACLKLKEYDEALFISMLFVISCPTEEEDALAMWIQTKKGLSSDSRQWVTFKDIIYKEENRMKCMNRKCEPRAYDLRKLLMMELMAYSSCPAFDVNTSNNVMTVLIKIWEMLKILDLELYDRAAALNNIVIAAISAGDSEAMKKYQRECEGVVAEILRSRDSRDCRSLLYAGNLKYALFLCHLKSIQDAEDKTSSSKSILEYLKKEEEEKVKFGEDVDLNLTCNVMPSTNHFTVSFEENYLTALNETLGFWEEAAGTVNPTSLESHEFNAWLHNIKHISQMYYLIGDVHQSFVSWILYYQIAKVCGNRPSILLALSQIIPECTLVENTKLLKEAEAIADVISSETKEKDILISYWLAVGLNHLKNRNRTGCLNYLLKSKNAILQIRDNTKYHIYYARYWCLVSKFLLLYHDEMHKFELKPDTELMTVAFRAFSHANSAVKDGSVSVLGSGEYMEILLTMLEVNVWAFNFFGVYSHTNFMRLFLDDLYQIFQKLVLPTRTAFILALLAEVDVMCEKVEDGNTKLNSLKRILGQSHMSSVEVEQPERKKPGTLEIPRSVEEEKESPRSLSPARFLDVHDAARERDPSPLRYFLSDVDLVKRLTHIGRCECYTCRSMMIKLLCVNALMLEARLNQINGSMKKSCIYFRDGYKLLKKLEAYQENLSDKMSRATDDFRGIIDFQGDLLRMNSVKFIMHYALFVLAAWKEEKVSEADKLINEIDKRMLTLSYEEKLMQWRIIELKLAAITIHELKDNQEEKMPKAPMRVTQSPNRILVKTPIATRKEFGNAAPVKYKQSKVIQSPNYFLSKPTGRKIFGVGDDDESPVKEEEEVKKKAVRRTARKKVESVMETRAKKRTGVAADAAC